MGAVAMGGPAMSAASITNSSVPSPDRCWTNPTSQPPSAASRCWPRVGDEHEVARHAGLETVVKVAGVEEIVVADGSVARRPDAERRPVGAVDAAMGEASGRRIEHLASDGPDFEVQRPSFEQRGEREHDDAFTRVVRVHWVGGVDTGRDPGRAQLAVA